MRVLRYEVPVDDEWHRVELAGDVVHVGCRNPEVVEFWTAHGEGKVFEFRVFGTGHDIDDGSYVGTTYAAHVTALVWHLFAREVPNGSK